MPNDMPKPLRLLFLLLTLGCFPLAAQSSPCGAPTPGAPKTCLTWVASTTPGVTYSVFRSSTAGGENYGSPLNAAPISSLFFADKSVTFGTTYFYTVVAVGNGGVLSAPSSEVSAQIPVPPNSPTTPAAAID